MAKIAGKRYEMRLEKGSLFVQRRHVMGLIDHDTRQIIISDEVPVADRLEFAEQLVNVAERGATDGQPRLMFTAIPVLS